MKAARIFVLGLAFAAGGAAAYFIGAGEEKKPQIPVAQSTVSTRSFAIRSLFGAYTITDGVTERSAVFAPPASVLAPTIAS